MLSSYMPRGEREPHRGDEGREDRVRAALGELEQGIDAIMTSEAFGAYLHTLARFHSYSANNVVLIHLQRPDATRVAGYRKWQELGRQVKKGEKGIRIFVPYRSRAKNPDELESEEEEHSSRVYGFGVGTVFDVAQTEGKSLPEPPLTEPVEGASEVGMRLFVDLLDYLDGHGIPVRREPLPYANGYFEPLRRIIGVDTGIDGDQATKTLAHETAHMVAGHTLGMDHREVETVAESAAFVVLVHYALDTRGYSFPYVARWAEDRRVLKDNLAAIGLGRLPTAGGRTLATAGGNIR